MMDRFRNVAGKRVQKVLDSLDSLAMSANRNNYEFDSADFAKMIAVIQGKMQVPEYSYTRNKKAAKSIFQFYRHNEKDIRFIIARKYIERSNRYLSVSTPKNPTVKN